MLNIIMTGGTSFIGIHLIQKLLDEGHKITLVIRPNSKNIDRLMKIIQIQRDLINIIELDLDDIDRLEYMKLETFDVFFHLAWDGVRMPEREDVKLQNKNFKNSMKALSVSKKLGCKKFVAIGSQAEYGMCMNQTSEESPKNPESAYGIAKLRLFEKGLEYSNRNGIHFIWARVYSLYGIYDYKNSLVMSVVNKMIKNEEILLTECVQKWNFLNVKDAANAIYKLSYMCKQSGSYNIASKDTRPLKAFVEEIKSCIQSKSILKYGHYPYPEDGYTEIDPLTDKIRLEVNWCEKISFKNGILEILGFIDKDVKNG